VNFLLATSPTRLGKHFLIIILAIYNLLRSLGRLERRRSEENFGRIETANHVGRRLRRRCDESGHVCALDHEVPPSNRLRHVCETLAVLSAQFGYRQNYKRRRMT